MAIERIFKGILGLVLIVAAVWLIVIWWPAVFSLVKGAVPFVVGLIGAVFLMLSFEK